MGPRSFERGNRVPAISTPGRFNPHPREAGDRYVRKYTEQMKLDKGHREPP